MSSDIHDKIASEILTGFWIDLKPHAERDAVFVVAQDLDLVEVAAKVAADDVGAVGGWLQDGSLKRPSAAAMKVWDTMAAKTFRFIIVQPHVLIQEQGH